MIVSIQILFVLYCYMIFLLLIGWFRNTNINKTVNLRVSVVIAVRNEQEIISDLISNLKSQSYDSKLYDVIVVNDHSVDDTLNELIKEASVWPNLKTVSYTHLTLPTKA